MTSGNGMKIESRKRRKNSSPPRPPKWGAQPQESWELQGQRPLGKPSTPSFPEKNLWSHMPQANFFNHQKVPGQGFIAIHTAPNSSSSPQPTTRVQNPAVARITQTGSHFGKFHSSFLARKHCTLLGVGG